MKKTTLRRQVFCVSLLLFHLTAFASPCDTLNLNSLANVPYYESFDTGFGLWTVENTDNDAFTWQQSTFDMCRSAAMIYCNNYSNSNIGSTDKITQFFDFRNANNLQLSFEIAHAQYNTSYEDRLRIIVTDCDGVMYVVFDKSGADLATVPPQTSGFVPQNCEDWRTETLDFSAFDGEIVQITFENTSGHSNRLYIDEIVIEEYNPNACDTPTALLETDLTTNGVTLSWNAELGASAYSLAGKSLNGNWLFFDVPTNSKTFSDVLQANKTYQWGVRAVCNDGSTTSWSAVQSFTTPAF